MSTEKSRHSIQIQGKQQAVRGLMRGTEVVGRHHLLDQTLFQSGDVVGTGDNWWVLEYPQASRPQL